MKKLARVGIDISATELVVALERAGGALQESSFANDAAGHRKLIKHIGKNGRTARHPKFPTSAAVIFGTVIAGKQGTGVQVKLSLSDQKPAAGP